MEDTTQRPLKLPIKAARDVASTYSLRQVIVLAWDGELTHIVTYGKSADDCSQAAQGGNLLKQKWGWPECNDQPSRVKTLMAENSRLSRQLELEVAARKLAEAARKEFFDDNKRLSRQLEEARAACLQVLSDINRAASNNVIWPDTRRQVERVLADKEGTPK